MPQQDHRRNIREKRPRGYTKDVSKYVMAPASAKKRKYIMEDRIEALKEFSETTTLNRIESASGKVGIITSGISYNHAKEVFGDEVSYLKLGFTWPLPEKLIRKFAGMVDTIYVIEENEPYIEDFVKIMGIQCTGEKLLGGRTDSGNNKKSFLSRQRRSGGYAIDAEVPASACSLRRMYPQGFSMRSEYKDVVVTGDIGCYTLE